MREETNEQQNRFSTSLFVVNLDTIQNFKAENLTTMLLILAFQNYGVILTKLFNRTRVLFAI